MDNSKKQKCDNKRKCGKKTRDAIKEPTKKAENLYGEPTMCDPLGSYTGQPLEKYEQPVQDADDL